MIPRKMAALEGLDRYKAPLAMEGGSFLVDGQGAVPTTEEEAWGIHIAERSKPRAEGDKTAASYLDFLIVNGGIILPTFDDPNDDAAREILAEVFPKRRVVTVPGREIVLGGDNVPRITQQQPRG
jgi:agmatine deiminase